MTDTHPAVIAPQDLKKFAAEDSIQAKDYDRGGERIRG